MLYYSSGSSHSFTNGAWSNIGYVDNSCLPYNDNGISNVSIAYNGQRYTMQITANGLFRILNISSTGIMNVIIAFTYI